MVQVQHANASAQAAGSLAVTVASTVKGNTILACAFVYATTGGSPVYATPASFTLITSQTTTNWGFYLWEYTTPGADTSYTFVSSGGTGTIDAIVEVLELANVSNTYDGVAMQSAAQTASTTWTGPSLTYSQYAVVYYFFAFPANTAGPTLTASAGSTLVDSKSAGFGGDSGLYTLQYQSLRLQTSGGSVSPTATTTSNVYVGAAVSFVQSAAAVQHQVDQTVRTIRKTHTEDERGTSTGALTFTGSVEQDDSQREVVRRADLHRESDKEAG